MTMQMDPTEFHDRLDTALREPGGPSVGAAVDGDIALGRRMLRRRRGAAALGAVAVLAVAAVAGGIAASSGDDSITTAGAPETTDELLEACRDGNQSDRATRAMFGAGDPTIKVESSNAKQTVLALEAADGAHWAYCWVHKDEAEFPSGMEVYDAAGTTRNSMYVSGQGCAGAVDDCRRFSLTVVDRRPAAVAAVEFWTAEGERTTVESVDGYIVLNYVGDLPEDVAMTPEGLPLDFAPLKRITFLDADGTPIAAEAQDGSGDGPDGEWVDGLPSIREFPALRDDQGIH
jgi:hypothetical protein